MLDKSTKPISSSHQPPHPALTHALTNMVTTTQAQSFKRLALLFRSGHLHIRTTNGDACYCWLNRGALPLEWLLCVGVREQHLFALEQGITHGSANRGFPQSPECPPCAWLFAMLSGTDTHTHRIVAPIKTVAQWPVGEPLCLSAQLNKNRHHS